MYFHCSVYKTSKLVNVFWIIGTHNVYKIIEVFMDIFKNRIQNDHDRIHHNITCPCITALDTYLTVINDPEVVDQIKSMPVRGGIMIISEYKFLITLITQICTIQTFHFQIRALSSHCIVFKVNTYIIYRIYWHQGYVSKCEPQSRYISINY